MSFLRRWFTKSDSDNYETVLSSLALDIQKRQTRLSEIRLRERRTTLLVTLYALALWFLYLGLWYTNLLPNLSGHRRGSKVEKAVEGVPVVLGPIVILFSRRIVQIWYTRIGDAEEKTLKRLLNQQRSKVEEIKKKTNYYSTRNLIERYDDSVSSDSPLRRRVVAPQQTPQQTPRQTPQTPALTPQRQSLRPNSQTTASLQAAQNNLAASPFPSPNPRKQWYDKLADALLGDDEGSATTAATRYALICEKCFAHNGLVKESMWEDAQYVCPKCGHFNASARSKEDRHSHSPTTPESATQRSAPSPDSENRAPIPHRAEPERGGIQNSASPKGHTAGPNTSVDESMVLMEVDQ